MEEFKVVAAPRPPGKKINVFKLHKDDDVSWNEAKMKRENDYQPWQIKLGSGKTSRRFKAIKEGGVGENASYFIFYKPKNFTSNTYEVCPVDEWYNVSATQRYKTLTAEEAEQKFEQRHKTLNYFSVMHMKKNGEAGEEGLSGSDSKAFKISEMDDWDVRSGDDFSDSDGDDGMDSKKKPKKKSIKREKEDEEAPQEGKEDSDEGDFEQREVDYMSDTSSESSRSEGGERGDVNDVKGIAEEEALRDLLSTDEEEDAEGSPVKGVKSVVGKNVLGTTNSQADPDGDNSDDSLDSDDYDVDEDKMDSIIMKKSLPSQLIKQENLDQDSSSNHSTSLMNQRQSGTSQPSATASKRKFDSSQSTSSISTQPSTSPPKRPCPADYSTSSPANSFERVVEDLIRKYLSRKPMTLKNMLKDVKSKLKRMGGITEDTDNKLVNTIATIIQRIKPERQKINDTIYLFLKT